MSCEFDIIFAGGGTVACVVAGRLAAAAPSLKILVVEMGQHSRDIPSHVQPYRFREHIAPESTTVAFHVAKPNEHLGGRIVTALSGRCVGGSSAVNFMTYIRGAASDYDDWAKLGNEGWSSRDLLPLVKKLETYTPKAGLCTHGYSGPIKISASEPGLGLTQQFLSTAKQYDPQRPQVDDCNDMKTGDAYSLGLKFIDPKTGKRSDAASAYLYPRSENANLQVLIGKQVRRVIIENGHAVGIEYTSDVDGSDDAVIVKASKLVVLSAGGLGSPVILERSGIGAKSILEQHNVPVIVDLPGVGENLMDHVGSEPAYSAAVGIDTMDDVWKDPKTTSELTKESEQTGKGKIAHTGLEGIAKVRPTPADLASLGPAFRSRWETLYKPNADKTMAFIALFGGSPLTPPTGKWLTMGYYLLYPESVGSVHITSGNNGSAPLDFDPRYFSKPSDVATFRLMYKKSRELARRLPSYRGDYPPRHPQFAPDSDATCRQTEGPVPIDTPDIAYSEEDNLAIDEYHRRNLQTMCHPMGTCGMKPREEGGVVDPRLNVYGIRGLKVADMSICPSMVGTTTYSTALLIGEKAALIIAQDLGINMSSEQLVSLEESDLAETSESLLMKSLRYLASFMSTFMKLRAG